MNKTTLQRFISWLDNNSLLLLSSLLLVLIPLYPKLPLFDVIPGYLVRVRIEDFAVLLTLIVWFVQVLRKKVAWRTPLTVPIALYAVVGLLSIFSAVFISKTVPAELLHIGKTSLHYFRYLEYFTLYFILASAIKTREQVKIVLGVMTLTLIAITIYGIGQKYWYWPVYSTMNREFAKGIRLVLTDHARVQSTFGGHYDLGAYLVLILPLLISLIAVSKKFWRTLLVVAYLGGVWLIFVSASRSSLIAYLVGSFIVILWHSLRRVGWKNKVLTFLGAGFLFLAVQGIFLRIFGDDLYQRVEQTINSFPVIARSYNATFHFVDTQWEVVYTSSKKSIDFVFQRGDDKSTTDEFANTFTAKKPENAITIDQVLVVSDARPEPARPADVYIEIPLYTQVATTSVDGTITYSTVESARNYSDNALAKGLSLAIRLDALWPRALAGFYTNPFFGSGYATLTKESTGQFTEAESTDNNFLRTIGETGALGFVTFYGVVVLAMISSWKIIRNKAASTLEISFAIGFIAASVGLLINAGFIDVFAASKVAFYYWALTGILFAIVLMQQKPVAVKKKRR
jgi:hypothetical protein